MATRAARCQGVVTGACAAVRQRGPAGWHIRLAHCDEQLAYWAWWLAWANNDLCWWEVPKLGSCLSDLWI